jgi:hypothetical protein
MDKHPMNLGDVFDETAEFLSPVSHEWEPVPKHLIGKKLNPSLTLARFNIPCRKGVT